MNNDALIALTAALIPAVGGALYTATQWGGAQKEIIEVHALIDTHTATLATQQQEIQLHEVHDAVIEQKLNDIEADLKRIEKKQR